MVLPILAAIGAGIAKAAATAGTIGAKAAAVAGKVGAGLAKGAATAGKAVATGAKTAGQAVAHGAQTAGQAVAQGAQKAGQGLSNFGRSILSGSGGAPTETITGTLSSAPVESVANTGSTLASGINSAPQGFFQKAQAGIQNLQTRYNELPNWQKRMLSNGLSMGGESMQPQQPQYIYQPLYQDWSWAIQPTQRGYY